MDTMFFIALAIGIMSRLIMLNLDKNQYPTQPSGLISQLVLAFVASALGSLVVPALFHGSYTSITFLSLAAEQFRKVRASHRDTLQNLEDAQLVPRGNAFIEEIARTYEVRNYMCIVTSCLTVGFYQIIISETPLSQWPGMIISAIFGVILAFLLKKMLTRQSIGDIADVSIVDIKFVNGSVMQVGDLAGITNIGLESDRKRFLEKGIGIKITPKDGKYENAGILYDMGQRQTILFNIYSRMGLYREENEPAFSPQAKRNPNGESIMIAYVPMEKDVEKLINAIKSCPILATAKGKNISLKNYTISKKGSV